MQLKKIKIAGFKSFVDPTTVNLPSHLIAIVGPNGCGKSNIIDAVCWVMGESSAKYLRGESLTDVIFNGSSARKPVGQASVELVFDNQDASLGGEYASYSEISIRRQINRDSESLYFLNGARCRRRDVIDIFLGTGLGPRSYSIIGQNMISRIIEAKPDEMRVYLEEAAGVSKFKERRRETENRIQHTKENLNRLNDIRTELEKQLNTLKRQATAAEKFKLLKQEERILRGEWLAIQWRQIDAQLITETLQIHQQMTALEAKQSGLSEINLQLEYQREAQHLANEAMHGIQRRFYTIGNDVTRLEQDLFHHQERQHQWNSEIERVEKDYAELNASLEQSEEEFKDLHEDIVKLEPTLQNQRSTIQANQQEFNQSENTMQDWQNQWDEFNQYVAKTTQIAEVNQTRIQHLEQKILSTKQRQEKYHSEKSQFDFQQLEKEIENYAQQVSEMNANKANITQQLNENNEAITQVKNKKEQFTEQLNKVRNDLQVMRGQQASLEALQQTALGQRNQAINEWLKQNKLDKQPRLAQNVEVESGWEYAVEKVLGVYLQAVCIEKMEDVVSYLEQFKAGNLCVVSQSSSVKDIQPNAHSLMTKVKSNWPLAPFLADIYVASSLEEAIKISKTLDIHESVITQEGYWLGGSWLFAAREVNPESGVFQREQDLKQLAIKISECENTQNQCTQTLDVMREQLIQLEKDREILQETSKQIHAQSAEVYAKQKMQIHRLNELKTRLESLQKEEEENHAQFTQAESELIAARDIWQKAMAELEQYSTERQERLQKRDIYREQLQQCKDQLNQLKEETHQLEIRLQTSQSQHHSCQLNITRIQAHMKTLSERKAVLEHELSSALSIETIQEDLNAALADRLKIEEELSRSRRTVEVINQDIQTQETQRQNIEREIAKLRDMLESLRVESQGLKVKAETINDQIHDIGLQLEDLLQKLPETVVAEEWQNRLQEITQRITRLGAINLVAIEEYTTCAERKQYLDKQNDDLQEGLATLENAIEKIDRETRARFKQTFDKVNHRFQELFPTIFSGGQAYMELTGESLLDAGIVVMACPPGKRNSSIHLLSGGEKALTAIALIFSIFHLNPAPFCLLDEVDAPLDDANIDRFCKLVQSMSEKTQFIFISHNKIAIEMGETLIGVTMNEPGVSRLVSVDVQEALNLANA